jgi:hypothetical protein
MTLRYWFGGVVRRRSRLWRYSAKSLGCDPERCIELTREVLKRNERSELDNGIFVEMRSQ